MTQDDWDDLQTFGHPDLGCRFKWSGTSWCWKVTDKFGFVYTAKKLTSAVNLMVQGQERHEQK